MPERKPTKIRLFASDLDNTLTGADGKVSAYTAQVIRDAMDMGYLFTFATGRQASSMWRLRDAVPVNAPVICCNGSELVDVFTGQVYHRVPVPVQTAVEFASCCLANGVDFVCRADDYECANETCVYLPVLRRRQTEAETAGRIPQRICLIRDAEDPALQGDFVKLLSWPKNREQHGIITSFCKEHPEIWTTSSVPGLIEIGPAGYDKGAGLRKLCEILVVSREETCVFGDYVNDIPLFESAGMAVAMGNADPSVRERATFVTAKNTEDGVALAMKRILSGEFG